MSSDKHSSSLGNESAGRDVSQGPQSAADSVANAFSGQLAQLQADLAEARARSVALEAELTNAHAEAQASADARVAEISLMKRNAAIREAAIGVGFVDMDCLPLLDTSRVSISEDGSIVGVDDAFSALKSNKPFLFSCKDGENRKTSAARPAVAPRERTPVFSSVRDMTDAEYRASLKRVAPSYARRSN
ncbi:phage scaffolding protein [Acetobacter sacchari]|uniref:Phage scaffolding protein n=1 Tax=Acetobacter sacchari TaxID=2661687 RepID=A0ABS3LXX3_9PROT|nr:phage scaffolding protein [Acetobacter sacchari]MBO1360759.1 phage scaffolding protein [Acetobacter sacchari]